jgi:hypothetical protein
MHFVADPPDAPEEVACVIHEQSGNMTCTWGTGKPTYIDTTYVVHVKRYAWLSCSFTHRSTPLSRVLPLAESR